MQDSEEGALRFHTREPRLLHIYVATQPRFFLLSAATAAARIFTGSNYPPLPRHYPESADITHERGSWQPMGISGEFIMQMSSGREA